MSQTPVGELSENKPSVKSRVQRYTEGDDGERYLRFIDEVLEVELTEPQEEIIETIANNRRVAVVGANGFGKSFALACMNLAFLLCNENSIAMATSGSYSQLSDTLAKPMEGMLQEVQRKTPLFDSARFLHNPPRINITGHPERFFKCVSVKNAGSLEGRHNDHVLVTIEEADKSKVDRDTIDSATSSLTDENDRVVAIGNPPRSEENSFNDLIESDAWETLQFSSFDSRNARIDAGITEEYGEDDKVPGLVGLQTIQDDWIDFNNEPWPGWDEARTSHDRNNLDVRWYRRRLGVIPPNDATAFRPYDVDQVNEATRRWDDIDEIESNDDYHVISVDIGRSGDRTVLVGANDQRADVLANVEAPGDHQVNKQIIQRNVDPEDDVALVIDSIGEGSGLADLLPDDYNVVRFDSRGTAYDHKHYNRRSQAYGNLGDWLADGGALRPQSDCVDELRSVARVMEYEERGNTRGTSLKVTSKSEIKSSPIGRSPDISDAVAMAAWGVENLVNREQPGFGTARYEYQ